MERKTVIEQIFRTEDPAVIRGAVGVLQVCRDPRTLEKALRISNEVQGEAHAYHAKEVFLLAESKRLSLEQAAARLAQGSESDFDRRAYRRFARVVREIRPRSGRIFPYRRHALAGAIIVKLGRVEVADVTGQKRDFCAIDWREAA